MSAYIVVTSQLNHITFSDEFIPFGGSVELDDATATEWIIGNTSILPKADFDAIGAKYTAQEIASASQPSSWGPVAPLFVRDCWQRLHDLRIELIENGKGV